MLLDIFFFVTVVNETFSHNDSQLFAAESKGNYQFFGYYSEYCHFVEFSYQ